MKLHELNVGQPAIIVDFDNDDISIKLMEMGLIPGEIVYIEKLAPFRDPISICVAGYSLSLRLSEADNIVVDKIVL